MPYLPWRLRPIIHHRDVIRVRKVIRPPAASARLNVTSFDTKVAWANHSTGATMTSNRDVALTPPTVSVMSANADGHRHPPWRSDFEAAAMSQGRPAKGSRMTEIR